jgi:hypothetical protein
MRAAEASNAFTQLGQRSLARDRFLDQRHTRHPRVSAHRVVTGLELGRGVRESACNQRSCDALVEFAPPLRREACQHRFAQPLAAQRVEIPAPEQELGADQLLQCANSSASSAAPESSMHSASGAGLP